MRAFCHLVVRDLPVALLLFAASLAHCDKDTRADDQPTLSVAIIRATEDYQKHLGDVWSKHVERLENYRTELLRSGEFDNAVEIHKLVLAARKSREAIGHCTTASPNELNDTSFFMQLSNIVWISTEAPWDVPFRFRYDGTITPLTQGKRIVRWRRIGEARLITISESDDIAIVDVDLKEPRLLFQNNGSMKSMTDQWLANRAEPFVDLPTVAIQTEKDTTLKFIEDSLEFDLKDAADVYRRIASGIGDAALASLLESKQTAMSSGDIEASISLHRQIQETRLLVLEMLEFTQTYEKFFGVTRPHSMFLSMTWQTDGESWPRAFRLSSSGEITTDTDNGLVGRWVPLDPGRLIASRLDDSGDVLIDGISMNVREGVLQGGVPKRSEGVNERWEATSTGVVLRDIRLPDTKWREESNNSEQPQYGVAVSKGSFSAFTIPAIPQALQRYSIVIEIRLPEEVTRYSVADLTGQVLGSDNYKQNLPYDRQLPFSAGYPTADGKVEPLKRSSVLDVEHNRVQIIIQVPGARRLVKDVITIKSRMLREEQELELVFGRIP